jgi:hypothetical protein
MNPVILYLKSTTRELDIALMKARLIAHELTQVLRTLRFKPTNWHDTAPFKYDLVIVTTEEGYLQVFSKEQNEYVQIYRLHQNDFLFFAFRLLNLLDEGVLKLKE